MKRIVLLICTLLLAQNAQAVFLIGYESARYKFEGNEKITSIPGFEVGVGFPSDSKLSIGGDLLLSIKPHKLKLNGYNKFYKVNSMHLDIFLKYNFMNHTTPYLILGGTGSMVFPSKTNASWKEIEGLKIETKYDYGLLFGAGIQIELYTVTLRIESRYRLGLANIDLEGIKFRRNTFLVILNVYFF